MAKKWMADIRAISVSRSGRAVPEFRRNILFPKKNTCRGTVGGTESEGK